MGDRLTIELDDPGVAQTGGGRVTGRVTVHSEQARQVDALTVQAQWQAGSRSLMFSGQTAATRLFTGPWTAGQRYTYPFAIALPYQPGSFRGQLWSLTWKLVAQAQTSGPALPAAEADFDLNAARDPAAATLAPRPGTALGRGLHRRATALWICSALAAVGAGGLALGILGRLGVLLMDPVPATVTSAFGLVLLLVFGLVALFLLPRVLAGRRLGVTECVVEPSACAPGAGLVCRLRFRPAAAVSVARATATLRGFESMITGVGRNRTRRVHTFFEQRTDLLASARDVAAGEEVATTADFTLPRDAQPSLRVGEYRVEWAVEFGVALNRFPDWQFDHAVAVRPSAP